MATTSAQRMGGLPAAGRAAGAVGGSNAVYAIGATMLAVEAAVHVQQYASIFYAVNWIGPLFLANAAACLLAAAGLAHARTRPLAALAGIAISTCALSGLVLSSDPACSAGWKRAGARRSQWRWRRSWPRCWRSGPGWLGRLRGTARRPKESPKRRSARA